MKKIFIASSLFFLFFAVAPHVFAVASDGFTALAPIPGLTDNSTTAVVNSTSLATFFNNLYKYLIGIAAILAIIQIIWAGIAVATNQDNVSKLTESKGKIMQAIMGLALVLSPVLVFSIINPSILNLSLNLPKLDTKTSTTTPSAATATPLAGGLNSAVSTDPSLRLMYCTNDPDCKNATKNCLVAQGRPQTPKCLSSDGKAAQVTSVDPKTNNLTCPSNLSLVVGCNVPTP